MEPPNRLLSPVIAALPDEDPEFVTVVTLAIVTELQAKPVNELFVIRVDNWFDRKWLNFSGIGRVSIEHRTGLSAYDPDTALDEFRRTGRQSTFPPFSPNRVISQHYYQKDEFSSYILKENGPRIYGATRAASNTNLQKRIATHSDSCLFAWFSSNTLANRRGSLMVYQVDGGAITTWYSSFLRDSSWHVAQTQGVSRQRLQTALLSGGPK